MTAYESDATQTIVRLHHYWNTHDLDGMLACFHTGYESIHPCHPDRNFKGLDALRAGWTAIFQSMPDFQAGLGRSATMGNTIWTEWCWRGTQAGGEPYESVGVIIFDIVDGQIVRSHVYSDVLPVEEPDWDGVLEELLRDQPEELED